MGVLLREKHPLQQLHSEKGGWFILEGGPIFKRLRYSNSSVASITPYMLFLNSISKLEILNHAIPEVFSFVSIFQIN